MERKTDNTLSNKGFYGKVISPIFSSKSFAPILVIVYIVLLIFFSALSENYMTVLNFKTIANNASVLGLVSVGVFLVMLAGEFDFSVGAVVSMTSTTVVLALDKHIPIPLVILMALCVGAIIGIVNGLIVVYVGVNSLIVTLATTEVFYGISLITVSAFQKQEIANRTFLSLGRTSIGRVFPIGMVYLIMLIILMAFILKFTDFGRNIYAVGGNREIARMVGIKTKRLKFTTFILSGVFASFAGMLLLAQLGAGRPEYGVSYIIDSVIVCVLGGLIMGGGKGDLMGLFLALIILGSITSGLYILGVSIYIQKIISGVMLILVLTINQFRYRRII